ncbi:MAG: hypothetical protein ACMXYD_00050 [Candidatus Woesearchaeota archaeon]
MSEVHIRINKRFVERTFFLLVIIGLVVALVLFEPSVVESADELASLQEQVQTLQAENTALQAQLTILQEQAEAAQEEPEEVVVKEEVQEEPEEVLSGVLDISYDYTASGGALQAFIVRIDNGLDNGQELTVRINWQGSLYQNVPDKVHEVFVQSGSLRNIIEDSLPSRPGDGIDTIRVSVRDANGNLVDQDTIRVL